MHDALLARCGGEATDDADNEAGDAGTEAESDELVDEEIDKSDADGSTAATAACSAALAVLVVGLDTAASGVSETRMRMDVELLQNKPGGYKTWDQR